jgi:SAM-dependent methyltransferase
MTIDAKIVDNILLCTGTGKALYVGSHPLLALGLLLQRKFDTYAWTQSAEVQKQCNEYYPDRCILGESLSPVTHTHAPVTALIIDNVLDLLPTSVLSEMLSRTYPLANNLVILVSQKTVEGVLRNRDWWETLCLGHGFRRHPRGQKIESYWQLNSDSDNFALHFEPVPEKALDAYSLDYLSKERDLHMDMLREAGRRSDAHLVRYHLATNFIRPGDTVLDCACGLGYGAYILYQCSSAIKILGVDLCPDSIQYATQNYGIPGAIEYQTGDAQNLSQLADNSVDFITSYETIEHLPDPLKYLSELERVLRPSGRILISVPNEWPIDPQCAYPPWHCQEYTWERFQKEVADHFLLDKGYFQTAGGSGRWSECQRRLDEIPLGQPLAEDAEWVLLLGMADPLAGRDVPFVETTHTTQPDHPDYHATAYAKSYINPWLAKGITTWPMHNSHARHELSQRIMNNYPEDSADYGAALCVLAYRYLEKDTPIQLMQDILWRIEKYILTPTDIPHCIRWKISLRYVGAHLHQKTGNFEQAENWFAACSGMDPLPFSIMSATKIIDACYHAARLALNRGEVELAQERLQVSVRQGRELLTGSWFNAVGYDAAPVTFGMHDLTQTMDYLVRSTYMLQQMSSWSKRPAQALETSMGLFERSLDVERKVNRMWAREWQCLVNYNRTLQDENTKLQNENTKLREMVWLIERLLKLCPSNTIRYACARAIWRLLKRVAGNR